MLIPWSIFWTVPNSALCCCHLLKVLYANTRPFYAWLNSSCYHPPPRHTPGNLPFFFHLTFYSPPPGTQKKTIPQTPLCLITHKSLYKYLFKFALPSYPWDKNVWFQKISIPPHGWFFSLNPPTPLEFPFQWVVGGPPHPPGISMFFFLLHLQPLQIFDIVRLK